MLKSNYQFDSNWLFKIINKKFDQWFGRKALANYLVQVGYLSFAILWKVYIGSYLGKGINTGDWHPFRFDSKNETELNIEDKIESTIEDKIKKSNSLESIFR